MLSADKLYLITDEKQVGYLTGYRTADGYAVIDHGKNLFFIDSRYYYAVKKQLGAAWQVMLGSAKEAMGYLAAKKETVYVDYRYTTLAFNEELARYGIKTADCSEEMKATMIYKSETELKNIEKACAIAEKAFKNTLKVLKVGMTELEVATYLESEFKRLGASGTSFETIVGFGAGSAVPHHMTGKTKLKPETVVLMDFGCLYKGYCSDMTRTFYFGSKPPKEFVKAYDSVLRAHVATYEGIYEGIPCADVDKLARDVLTADGYGKLFTHSLGHGVGVNIHEPPWLSPKGKGELHNGMVHSIEPGVYIDGKFGIRIEDTVCMKDKKAHTFMKTTKKLFKIKVKY